MFDLDQPISKSCSKKLATGTALKRLIPEAESERRVMYRKQMVLGKTPADGVPQRLVISKTKVRVSCPHQILPILLIAS